MQISIEGDALPRYLDSLMASSSVVTVTDGERTETCVIKRRFRTHDGFDGVLALPTDRDGILTGFGEVRFTDGPDHQIDIFPL